MARLNLAHQKRKQHGHDNLIENSRGSCNWFCRGVLVAGGAKGEGYLARGNRDGEPCTSTS